MDTADRAALEELILREYGITPETIVPGPRGWVGETYIVTTGNGRRVFAKLLPTDGHFVGRLDSLPVLEELHARGITTVSRPLRTHGGSLTAHLTGQTLILFDYIAGRASNQGGYDFAAYVTL